MKKDYRALTKNVSWEMETNQGVTDSHLQTSALLRIADATEIMAVNYASIIKAKQQAETDRDKYYRWYQEKGRKLQNLNGVYLPKKA